SSPHAGAVRRRPRRARGARPLPRADDRGDARTGRGVVRGGPGARRRLDRGEAVTDEELAALEERLGHPFADRTLLRTALTHRSSVVEHTQHNETLEFLGDAVLGLVVSELLLRAWPQANEGQLSKRRAALVNASSLARKAEALGLGPLIHLGRG